MSKLIRTCNNKLLVRAGKIMREDPSQLGCCLPCMNGWVNSCFPVLTISGAEPLNGSTNYDLLASCENEEESATFSETSINWNRSIQLYPYVAADAADQDYQNVHCFCSWIPTTVRPQTDDLGLLKPDTYTRALVHPYGYNYHYRYHTDYGCDTHTTDRSIVFSERTYVHFMYDVAQGEIAVFARAPSGGSWAETLTTDNSYCDGMPDLHYGPTTTVFDTHCSRDWSALYHVPMGVTTADGVYHGDGMPPSDHFVSPGNPIIRASGTHDFANDYGCKPCGAGGCILIETRGKLARCEVDCLGEDGRIVESADPDCRALNWGTFTVTF